MSKPTVWVLWSMHRKGDEPSPYDYSVSSKRSWQKECDYNKRTDEALAKLGAPPRGRVLRHIAESHDRQLLITMLGLLEK